MDISILITTYNAAQYIVEALETLGNQTYPPSEVIIVDDGSTDATREIIQNFLNSHPQINIRLFSYPHIGRAAALHQGVQLAGCEWIAILDADDLWHCQKLAQQVTAVQQYNLNFLATQSDIFYSTNEPDLTQEFVSLLKPVSLSLTQMLYANLICHSSVLMRKNLAQYDLQRQTQIDYELWLRLLHERKSLYILPQTLVYHRIHKKQSFEAQKKWRYIFNATKLQLRYCFYHLKLLPACALSMKLGYYLCFPRNIRLKIRTVAFLCKNKINQITKIKA